MRKAADEARSAGTTVGFVPTMGALHDGHRSLLRRARQENDRVVASNFVNPTQFTEIEDYEAYPRDPERDRQILAEEGVDIVFEPDVAEMYPWGFDTVVAVRALSSILEGEHRPGHFQGVATVVTKLFCAVHPTRAYFGQKDYQQLKVIKRLTTDLNLGIEIVTCPTLREPDGLALSSRNIRLISEDRKAARVLSAALANAQEIADTGIHDAYVLRAYMAQTIAVETRANLDYAVIVDPEELREVDTIDAGAVALVAARFGSVRLIDNQLLRVAPGAEVRR